jgi:hypothetical protein
VKIGWCCSFLSRQMKMSEEMEKIFDQKKRRMRSTRIFQDFRKFNGMNENSSSKSVIGLCPSVEMNIAISIRDGILPGC